MVDLDDLERRTRAATPGPWVNRPDTPWGSKVIFNSNGEMFIGISVHTSPPTEGWSPAAKERARQLGANKCADAEYIAAASPDVILALVGALRVAQQDADRLYEYARHDEGCNAQFGDNYRCRCLFVDALAAHRVAVASRSVGDPQTAPAALQGDNTP